MASICDDRSGSTSPDSANRFTVEVRDGSGWSVAILDPEGREASTRACRDEAEAETFASTVRQHIGWLSEELLAGTVHELETVLSIEREHGNVDLLHDLAEKCGRFERTESLRTQRGAHRVHLLHHLSQRVLVARTTGTDGVIAFPHGFEQIRQSP